jgi:hypothetical protein
MPEGKIVFIRILFIINYYFACISMLRIFTFFFLLLTCELTYAQFDSIECLDKHYTKLENIGWLLKSYRGIYGFRRNEKIASVGAGSGVREIIYSMMEDSLTFYLQDVNPVCLQPETLSQTIEQIYQIVGRKCTASFIPVRGKETDTRLPEQFFDKIIVENSMHEFSYSNEMLASIRGNLKNDGYLFVWELIASRPGKKHKGCRKPLFTEENLIHLLDINGFKLIGKTVVDPHYPDDRVYKFTLK